MRGAMFKEKLEYMIEVEMQLRSAMSALTMTTGKTRQVGTTADTFSAAYKLLRGFDSMCQSNENVLRNSDFYFERSELDILQADFQFSDNPIAFSVELGSVLSLFASAKGGDPAVDFLAMRALFHSGKILGTLEAEGAKRSDGPSKAGSTHKKNRYSDEQIINAFHECHAKTANDMEVEIDNFLSDHKKRTGDKRDIPSKSTTLRVLKAKGLNKLLPK